MRKKRVERKCPTCGSVLSKNNKSGFCSKHRDRTGKNNSFYGKKHSEETKQKIKQTCKIDTTERWKDDAYRAKVIKGISKPRRETFKKEQSERITQWYKDNPEQREIRSTKMKETWKEGKITASNTKFNRSKIEMEFYTKLEEYYPFLEEKQTIHHAGSYYFPDIVVSDLSVIVEFYGDFWHANPEKYNASDIIHHGQTAKDVWEHDKKREEKLLEAGYPMIVVWEKDYKENPEGVLKGLDIMFNWEVPEFA